MKTLKDFIYYIEKYIDLDKEYTDSQIASIIGRVMVDFFEDSKTPY